MSKEELKKLAEAGKVKIPERFLDELGRYFMLEMTDAEVATTVKTKMPDVSGEGKRDSTENKTRRQYLYT